MIIRTCKCGYDRCLHMIFMVGRVKEGAPECPKCHRLYVGKVAEWEGMIQEGHQISVPLPWLKKIEPPKELDVNEYEKEMRT